MYQDLVFVYSTLYLLCFYEERKYVNWKKMDSWVYIKTIRFINHKQRHAGKEPF